MSNNSSIYAGEPLINDEFLVVYRYDERRPIQRFYRNRQRGVATLTFALVILLILTIMIFYSARVGLLNEKMAANDFRAQESAVTAEAGMSVMMQALTDNFTKLCTTGACLTTDSDYTLTGTLTDYLGEDKNGIEKKWSVTASVLDDDPVIINVIATGSVSKTVDGNTLTEATAHITQQLSKTTLLTGKPASPLILTEDFTPIDNVSIVSNPNGVNCGVSNLHGKFRLCAQDVSVWSVASVNRDDTFTTCNMDSFINVNPDAVYTQSATFPLCNQTYPDCHCANGEGLSGKWAASDADFILGQLGSDIVAPPIATVTGGINFPTDLFSYLFGSSVSKSFIKSLAQSKAGHYLINCDSLSKNSSGLYWVTGDCNIASGAGWITNPVFLIIEGGVLRMSGATTQVFGVAYIFSTSGAVANIQLSGGFWYGGIIDDSGTESSLQNVSVIYSDAVFEALKHDLDFAIVSAIPGSWRDW